MVGDISDAFDHDVEGRRLETSIDAELVNAQSHPVAPRDTARAGSLRLAIVIGVAHPARAPCTRCRWDSSPILVGDISCRCGRLLACHVEASQYRQHFRNSRLATVRHRGWPALAEWRVALRRSEVGLLCGHTGSVPKQTAKLETAVTISLLGCGPKKPEPGQELPQIVPWKLRPVALAEVLMAEQHIEAILAQVKSTNLGLEHPTRQRCSSGVSEDGVSMAQAARSPDDADVIQPLDL